jgi:hypothetical protein
VRVEWPDGRITHEWETPAPEIAPLKTALVTIARQDGTALIALNALREADHLETEVARRCHGAAPGRCRCPDFEVREI